MKYKIGDKVCYKHPDIGDNIEVGEVGTIRGISPIGNYAVDFETKDVTKHNCNGRCHNNCGWWCAERTLELVVPTLVEIKEKKLTCVIHTPTRYSAEMVVNTIPVDSEGTIVNNWSSFWDYYEDNTCYKIVDGELHSYQNKKYFENHNDDNGNTYTIYEFSDLFPVGSAISNGFRGDKKPKYVLNAEQAKEYADNIIAMAESISAITGISYENSINKLKTCLGTFSNDGISAKNGGKNSMKFTFYTEEGYRIDKSNNTRIPTMTTEVLINGKDYQYGGSATCDKTDYEEREGVLNAIANAVCGGNFDREFNKVMKNKAFYYKKSRTCTYCGQVFDTVEEKQEHEAWHVERRKARHERYLLRKRAKEIAFEEQAQKMAKEMIKEDK